MLRFRSLAAWISLALGANAFLWGIGGVAGAWSGWLDALNHFAPWAAVMAGMALALAAAARRPQRGWLLGLAAAGLGAQVWLIGGALLAPRASAPDPAVTVRVLTFNAHGKDNRDYVRLIAMLEAENPDIVALQEVYPESRPLFAQVRKRWPYMLECVDHADCDLALFSRVPFQNSRLIRWEWRRGRINEPNVAVLTGWLQLRGSAPFSVSAIHIPWPVPPGPQAEQLREMAIEMRAIGQAPKILVGDFNATPWGWALKRFERASGLQRGTRGLLTFPTQEGEYRFPFPLIAIDHVFTGAGAAVLSARRAPSSGSDHFPVVAEIAVPKEGPQTSAATFSDTILPGARGGSPFGKASTASIPLSTTPQTVY
jgi:endonuclease/exonuclease/phosphatase (EEP) superfamily protein YafD